MESQLFSGIQTILVHPSLLVAFFVSGVPEDVASTAFLGSFFEPSPVFWGQSLIR